MAGVDIELLRTLCSYILMFVLFSVLGWIMEVTLKYVQFRRFINRGFLIGPVCPIYGAGAVLVTAVVRAAAGENAGYLNAFLTSFFFCSALEYLVSWLMEKTFHARWWDYSERPMNLEGRIWIGNSVLFGLGGVVIVKWVAPALFYLFGKIPERALLPLCVCPLLVMFADYVASYIITRMVRSVGEASEGDDTETISTEIRLILSQKSIFYKRLLDAYPNMQARTKKIQRRLSEERRRFQQRIREERARYYRHDNKNSTRI